MPNDPDPAELLTRLERILRRHVGDHLAVSEHGFGLSGDPATESLRLWLDVRRELRATIADEAQTQPGPTAPQESE